jgi:hypothetical protein
VIVRYAQLQRLAVGIHSVRSIAVGFVGVSILQLEAALMFHHSIERELEHLVEPIFLFDMVGN